MDYSKADFSIPVSIFDYVPLSKTRRIKSQLIVDGDPDKDQTGIKIEYDIVLTVKGICSGRRFRQIFSDILQAKVQERKQRYPQGYSQPVVSTPKQP